MIVSKPFNYKSLIKAFFRRSLVIMPFVLFATMLVWKKIWAWRNSPKYNQFHIGIYKNRLEKSPKCLSQLQICVYSSFLNAFHLFFWFHSKLNSQLIGINSLFKDNYGRRKSWFILLNSSAKVRYRYLKLKRFSVTILQKKI